MKTIAAFFVALSLSAAAAAHATIDTGHATAAPPAFAVDFDISDASLLPPDAAPTRQPEKTALFFIFLIIMCMDHPDQC